MRVLRREDGLYRHGWWQRGPAEAVQFPRDRDPPHLRCRLVLRPHAPKPSAHALLRFVRDRDHRFRIFDAPNVLSNFFIKSVSLKCVGHLNGS